MRVMVTKECDNQKMCCFCASDFHLEMILLPYIKEKINDCKFIIMTEDNLEGTLKVLLTRVNINNEDKNKIWKLNWKNKKVNKLNIIKKYVKNDENICVIINGKLDYIRQINFNLRDLKNGKINIVDCYHIGDPDFDIEKVINSYDGVLNTKRI